jgi:arabinose-5-phosphate isomerase
MIETGRAVLSAESRAIADLVERLDGNFEKACRLILTCQGRVVVVGIGKSGHVAGKIASTLASTGTPAFFVHPGEASHGDLGMITPSDLVIAASNSGETPEILTILPIIKRMGVKLVALCGNTDSTLARQSDACLDVGVHKEACPLNLAPTTSTTATLAMGDALAIAILEARGFTAEDFARAHPGGVLGRRLLLYVRDIMHRGADIPLVRENDLVRDALLEMSGKHLGMTGVVDADGRLVGLFTDGDLRRALNKPVDLNDCPVRDVMTRDPITVGVDMLAAEVITLMRTESINGIFVVSDDRRVEGALNMHDLLRAGVV